MSPPWMPLYIGDYLADTGRLSTLEHGAYLLLIMDYWRNGGLPSDERKLARIARLSADEWASVRENLSDLFLDGWKHKRIDKELARSAEKSEAARLSARMRWHSVRIGDAMPTHENAYANGMLSQSQSQIEKNNPSLRSGSSTTPENGVADLTPVEIQKPKSEAAKAGLKAFGEAWNLLAASFGLPSIDSIKPGSPRERSGLRALRDLQDDFEGGHDLLLAKIRESPYLRGEVNGFKCTFDWVCKPMNFQKIMENNYEVRKEKSGFGKFGGGGLRAYHG